MDVDLFSGVTGCRILGIKQTNTPHAIKNIKKIKINFLFHAHI